MTDRWNTGTPTEDGLYVVCIRYDLGHEYYTTGHYVMQYNRGWTDLKQPSYGEQPEGGNKVEIVAWQKLVPFRGEEPRKDDPLRDFERRIKTAVFNDSRLTLDAATWRILSTLPRDGIYDLIFGGDR